MLRYESPKLLNAEYFRNTLKYQRRWMMPPEKGVGNKSVSLVTRCMNRLHDLKITLPKNIEDNKEFQKLEFVLLDYNSTDGLDKWVKEHMMEHINSGRLQYYRTQEPEFFCPNHSQNLTFRLSRNEVVANVDADNFTHHGYAQRISDCASLSDGHMLIVPNNFLLPGSKKALLKGRFAMFKKDIESLRGFDEDLDAGFGNDDLNFVFRAMLSGFAIVRYEKEFAEGRLPTSNEERVMYVKNPNYKEVLIRNGNITWDKLSRGVTSVNRQRHWGKGKLIRNFSSEVEV